MLLPGGAASYDEFQADGSTPSTLPQQLSDAIIAETRATHHIPGDRVIVGGFSGGGTPAVRFAAFCAAARSVAPISIRGVFASDAAGLVPQLQLLGNHEAQLVPTQGRG